MEHRGVRLAPCAKVGHDHTTILETGDQRKALNKGWQKEAGNILEWGTLHHCNPEQKELWCPGRLDNSQTTTSEVQKPCTLIIC